MNLKKNLKNNQGKLILILGPQGSGKTTIGKGLFKNFKKKIKNTVYYDGDIIRNIILNFDYTEKGRKKLDEVYYQFVMSLLIQNINVIFSTVHLSTEILKKLKKRIFYCKILIIKSPKSFRNRNRSKILKKIKEKKYEYFDYEIENSNKIKINGIINNLIKKIKF